MWNGSLKLDHRLTFDTSTFGLPPALCTSFKHTGFLISSSSINMKWINNSTSAEPTCNFVVKVESEALDLIPNTADTADNDGVQISVSVKEKPDLDFNRDDVRGEMDLTIPDIELKPLLLTPQSDAGVKANLVNSSIRPSPITTEHGNTQQNLLACQHCGYQCENLNELGMHSQHSKCPPHPDTLTFIKFNCNECNNIYLSRDSLAEHQQTEHESSSSNVESYDSICRICRYSTTSFVALTKHFQDCHEGFYAFPCTFCGKQFSYIEGLASHSRTGCNPGVTFTLETLPSSLVTPTSGTETANHLTSRAGPQQELTSNKPVIEIDQQNLVDDQSVNLGVSTNENGNNDFEANFPTGVPNNFKRKRTRKSPAAELSIKFLEEWKTTRLTSSNKNCSKKGLIISSIEPLSAVLHQTENSHLNLLMCNEATQNTTSDSIQSDLTHVKMVEHKSDQVDLDHCLVSNLEGLSRKLNSDSNIEIPSNTPSVFADQANSSGSLADDQQTKDINDSPKQIDEEYSDSDTLWCRTCGFKCKAICTLFLHFRDNKGKCQIHPDNSRTQGLKCERCEREDSYNSYSYSSIESLAGHYRRYHGIKVGAASQEDEICRICNYTTKSGFLRMRHHFLECHKGESTYVCERCGRKSNLGGVSFGRHLRGCKRRKMFQNIPDTQGK